MNTTPKGYIPVMLTPFKENGAIDFDALTQLTEFYINSGAVGLFANCLSSEMFELTPDERLQLTAHVVKAAAGRVPVVATGTFGGTIEEQAAFIKEIYKTGIQAAIAITGLIAEENESDEIFNERIHQLIDLTENIPLGFYECPVPYKRLISAAQLGEFVKTGRVIYHKDTSLDLDNVKAKIAACEGYNFGLYDAYMAHAVVSLKAGSSGVSCIQGNYFPELISWLCNNFNNPEQAKNIDLFQQFLIDNMDVMHDVYPTCAKYYLQKRGVNISLFTRREVGTFTDAHKAKVDQLFEAVKGLQEQISVAY